jgi:hypothetical protein
VLLDAPFCYREGSTNLPLKNVVVDTYVVILGFNLDKIVVNSGGHRFYE